MSLCYLKTVVEDMRAVAQQLRENSRPELVDAADLLSETATLVEEHLQTCIICGKLMLVGDEAAGGVEWCASCNEPVCLECRRRPEGGDAYCKPCWQEEFEHEDCTCEGPPDKDCPVHGLPGVE